MTTATVKFGYCIQRPNGHLWDKTFATSPREAWWQFIVATGPFL